MYQVREDLVFQGLITSYDVHVCNHSEIHLPVQPNSHHLLPER